MWIHHIFGNSVGKEKGYGIKAISYKKNSPQERIVRRFQNHIPKSKS